MEATITPDSIQFHSDRIAVEQGAEPTDWQDIYERVDRRANGLAPVLVKAAAATSTFAGIFMAAAALALGISRVYPEISVYYLACFVLLPALLAGAAAGQAGGNLLFRLWFGLDDASRRGFATRLTLARAPETWPAEVRRWLFTGDWLGTPAYDLRLPYARIFVVGAAPATCREEDALWREIHDALSIDCLCEIGGNHREISYPRELPAWAKQIGRGDGFDELQKRIGADRATEWTAHLWRRAVKQWPALEAEAFPGGNRPECFELHSLNLAGGREALLVALRPANFVEEAFAEPEQHVHAA